MTILVIKPTDRAAWLTKADAALKFLNAEIEKEDMCAKQAYQDYQKAWRTTFWGRVELLFNKDAKAPSCILSWSYRYPDRYRRNERRIATITPFKNALCAPNSEDIHVHIDCIDRIAWTLAEIKNKE